MKRPLACPLAAAALLLAACSQTPTTTTDIPHLEQRFTIGTATPTTKLIVDGHPFICIAGEVANTSSSDPETMKLTIPRLAKANLNTILTVLSWDLIEPQEGHFDFSWIDYQIKAAREANVRLIFLWMGSWKNGLSHFPPEWVKADQRRFPRVVNADGNSLEILSALSSNSRDADAKAFAAVMRHIRQVDAGHTVIAMQVENESGVLGSTRDFSPAATAAYNAQVPPELMQYLQNNNDQLNPDLKKLWDAAGHKTRGPWEEVFGKNIPRTEPPVPNSPTRTPRPANFDLFTHTDELFMAWNYAQYIGRIAAEGKKEYPLPMYVNTWIVQTMDRGPGDYPSGGAQPLVHDVWHAGAPAIDILAPDIYLPQFADILGSFTRNGNPAWVPETRANSQTAWDAFTQLNLLCYSPFGIDNLSPDGGLARTYGFLNSISGALAEAQGNKDAIKLITPAAGQLPEKVQMANYTFEFLPQPRGRGGPAAAPSATTSAPAPRPGDTPALSFLATPFILIIRTGPDEFYFATNGNYPFRASSTFPGPYDIFTGDIASDPNKPYTTAPATIDRGTFINGHWSTAHRLNGDDLMGQGYDLSAAAAQHFPGTQIPLGSGRGASPTGTTVFRVRFYKYL